MKKIIFTLLFTVFCFGAGEESENIIRGSAYGKEVVKESVNQNFTEYTPKKHYRKEAIYNLVLWNNTNKNERQYTANLVELINLVEDDFNATNIPTITRADSNLTVKGYCLIRNDIQIGKQPASAKLLCNTNIGQIEIMGNLTPINEMATLLYDPSYIEYKNWRYKVISSRVLNESMTSYNIATFVNDRKIAKIALETTSNSAEVIKTQSSEYLRELEDSREKETTEYVMVGNTGDSYIAPVQNKNTEKPRAGDYIAKAFIDIGSELVQTAADVFKEDLPYLYEILGGSRIYIDLIIDIKGEKIL